jgi:hypothetical protein
MQAVSGCLFSLVNIEEKNLVCKISAVYKITALQNQKVLVVCYTVKNKLSELLRPPRRLRRLVGGEGFWGGTPQTPF